MFNSPDSGFESRLLQTGISFLWMKSSEVEHMEFSLQSSCDQFVHHNVLSVELESTDSIL